MFAFRAAAGLLEGAMNHLQGLRGKKPDDDEEAPPQPPPEVVPVVPDHAPLAALYRSTGGTEWERKHNWSTDAELSQWHGVEVNEEGRVVKLLLYKNNLQGSIPAELGKLAALKVLEINGNGLTGPIPDELGALSELENLRLEDNKLTGTMPKKLGKLAALRDLRLHSNDLTGFIPKELGALSKLENLRLDNNKLTGPIPNELGELQALKTLHLQGNGLRGGVPKSLRKHPNRSLGAFSFGITDDGAPVPKWKSGWSVAFPLVLGYLDLGTDVAAVISYYHAGHEWWFALGLVFIVLPAVFAAVVLLRDEDWLRRVFVALNVGLLYEALFSLAESSYSHVLVTLRVVEPLYESVPQLMLQIYGLLLEWDAEGELWLPRRLFSVLVSCFSLAYATTGMVAEHALSQISLSEDVSTAQCASITGLIFSTVPATGSIKVFGSTMHPQNFVWAFLLYQGLEIGSRFISLALLALVWRGYFFLVLVWLWISRSVILGISLGRGEGLLSFRSQLRLVGMPFMDSIMDALKSYDAGCALTTLEFLACLAVGNTSYKNEEGQASHNVCRVWTYVAVVFMLGKLVLGCLVVRPFKKVVQEEQTLSSYRRGRNRDVESGGRSGGGDNVQFGSKKSRGTVREVAGPERKYRG